MIADWNIYLILLLYIGVMYLIAVWGEGFDLRYRHKTRIVVYAFSIAVYCTSWTFFGAVGTAARSGWNFLPIYLGPLLLFTFGWPLLQKIIHISKNKNVTSLADFVAVLYGKSRRIGVLVTVVAVVAAIPYIALQIEAMSTTVEIIGESNHRDNGIWAASITLLLAIFSMIFGTKKLDVSEHHRGLMMALAFESLLKLLAFVAIGIWVVFFLYSGPKELWQAGQQLPKIASGPTLSAHFLAQTVLALLVFFCLPRQFHVVMVENSKKQDLLPAAWVFAAYLCLFILFVIPIAMAGNQLLDNSHNPDWYILQLPMALGNDFLTLLVLLGGLAAAGGMVMIATIALSTMLSNDLLLPIYLKWKKYHLKPNQSFKSMVLWTRRICILFISLAALLFYEQTRDGITLSAMGNLSFLLMVQFAPAMLLGIYWKLAVKQAAFWGILTGVGIWLWLIFWVPTERSGDFGMMAVMQQLSGEDSSLLKFFVMTLSGNLSVYVVSALFVRIKAGRKLPTQRNWSSPQANHLTVADLKQILNQIVGIRFTKRALANFAQQPSQQLNDADEVSTPLVLFSERLLAGSIGASSARAVMTALLKSRGVAIDEIVNLLDETKQAIRFNRSLTEATLDHISQGISVIDNNLRLVAWNKQYISLLDYPEGFIKRGMPIEQALQFNASRGLLGGGPTEPEIKKRIRYLSQGHPHYTEKRLLNGTYLQIEGNPMPNGGYLTCYSDVTHYKQAQQQLIKSQQQITFYTDNSPAMLAYICKAYKLRFVNKAYRQFFGKTQQQLLNQPISTVIRQSDMARLKHLLEAAFQGQSQTYEMEIDDHLGQQHFIIGTHVPDIQQQQVVGLFVIMQDISSRRRVELQLQQAKTELEQRVTERTAELAAATEKAQQANLSKTKFIADASHDLLQPFNAARLFASILSEKSDQLSPQIAETVQNLDQSLKAAEQLLSSLLNIAKIDAGGLQPNISEFPLNNLLTQLQSQYRPKAHNKGVKLKARPTKLWVKSDEKLLYRVLQNLTANAVRYTEQGRILIAARKSADSVQIIIADTGIGFSESEQQDIFKEFKRLNKVNHGQDRGLGLGLAIVERILTRLEHPLSIQSEPDKGSIFSLKIPRIAAREIVAPQNITDHNSHSLLGIKVLCIDNETAILTGMEQLLSNWEMQVKTAENHAQAAALLEASWQPQLLLVDYQLDDQLGTELVQQLFKQFQFTCPTVIITANRDETVKQTIKQSGFDLLYKPIKPARLRQLLNLKDLQSH